METEEIALGDIEFSGKDMLIQNLRFDRIAVSGTGELLLLSVTGDQMRIKQIAAILRSGLKCDITAGGVKVGKPDAEEWRKHSPGRIRGGSDGYQVFTHKLGYGEVHALLITRSPGFLPIVSEESLWQELKGGRFTTPLLREWTPYIEGRLRADDRLEDANCYNCRCGILSSTVKHLDEVVTEGLQQHMILIPN